MPHNRLIRYILEVKLKNRLFSFVDFRGEMVDYLIAKNNFDQVKLAPNGVRFDLANDKRDRFYFASLENFGFQSEANVDFSGFKTQSKYFIDSIRDFKKYNIEGGLARIGVKCVILDRVFGLNKTDLKKEYDKVIFGNSLDFLGQNGISVFDTCGVFDIKNEKSKLNVVSGVVTKEEGVLKFFDNKDKLYDFGHGHGLLFAIDSSYDGVSSVTDWSGLEEAIEEQVSEIESTFDGFKARFPSKE
jgi:hypothetical protein